MPLQKVVPPVIVEPSGSGVAQGTKMFFVEATAGKLTIYWDPEKKTVLSSTPEVVTADPAYNHFLKEVQKVPQSKIIFLMRDDGTSAYNNGAGWAQATYGFRVDQIGRLLLPGRGAADLRNFKDYMGMMAPPPDAKLVPPPKAPAPAPAPGTPAPAKPAAPAPATPAPTSTPAAPAAPAAPKPAAPAPAAATPSPKA